MGRWITTKSGAHVFIEDGQNFMDAFIKQKGGTKEITAKELMDDYYKKELDYDDDLLKVMEQSGMQYKKDIQELKNIIESKDAKDQIDIRGYKVNVNLHKKDVDIDESISKYKNNSIHMNNLLNKKGEQMPMPDTIRDIEDVSSSLKQLDSYKGTVWRYDDRTELPKPNETIKINSFYSTSSNKEDLDLVPYYTTRKTLYEIESKNGKKLNSNGRYTNEHEVLFDLNSEFQVVKAEVRDGKNYILMREK